MAIWDRMLDRAIQRLGYVKAGREGLSVGTLLTGESPTVPAGLDFNNYTDEQRERLALTSSWVFSDINLIAGICAGAELGIYERQGEQLVEVVDHPFEQLIQQPFRFWPKGFTFWYTMSWWLLRGEAYWWKILDGAGELAGLLPVPAGRMEPIPDAEKYISGFAYKPLYGRTAVRIPAEQVVFFRFPNPFDFHRGLSPRTGYQLALETDVAAQRWNRDTFTKEATLRTLFSLPADLDPKVYRQAKEEILRELVELGRRYMVARGGQLTVATLGLAHKDLEFLAGREFTREEIDRVFGVPAGFWAKDATRANAEAARATLIENTIWPILTLMHDAITEQVVIPAYGEAFRARFVDIRPRDRRLQIEEHKQNWQVMTVDEARAELGKDPLEDSSTGAMLVPVAAAAGRAMGMTGMGGMGGGGGREGKEGKEGKAIREELKRWRSVVKRAGEGYEFESKVIPQALMDGVRAAIGAVGVEGAFRFVKQAPDARDEIETRVLEVVAQVLSVHIKKFSGSIVETGREPDYGPLSNDLSGALEPELTAIATEVALRTAMEVGVEFDIAVINAAALDWARTYTYELIKGLTATTQGVVRGAVSQFIRTAGMTREQLEALLQPAFGDVRASMIAVTEVTRAYSAATRMYENLLEAAGIRMNGYWQTRADELVCPICGPLNNKPEEVWKDAFRDGPPAHVNCRCWVVLRYAGRKR